MFKNIIKKILPIGVAVTGASMLGGGGFSKFFASSPLTNKFKNMFTTEALKRGVKSVTSQKDYSDTYTPDNVDLSDYMVEMASLSSPGGSGGGVKGFPGPIKAADSAAISYMWQRRLNSYLSGEEKI